MKWVYGVQTVSSRLHDSLPRTLESLKIAGFDKPRLFVDGCKNSEASTFEKRFNLEVTARYPAMRVNGNWVLSMAELYIRDPHCDVYAMFQDDIICCKNLRAYLDRCKPIERGYWNLYTAVPNYEHAKSTVGSKHGWFKSNQRGQGALALVIGKQSFLTLFKQPHMIEKPQDPHRGWRTVDGGIAESFNQLPHHFEWCHIPSLVQHQCVMSTIGNHPKKSSPCFAGEDYDALRLLVK